MKKRLLLLMMMAGGAMMLPAQEPGRMLPAQEPGGMLPAQEQVEMASIDAASAVIEQTDAATVEQTDTVLPDPDPEWYVAPKELTKQGRAPRRAEYAGEQIDSVLTYDVNSVLVEVTHYEYGDTIRTMIWGCNPDGSRYGKSREEYAFNESGLRKYDATFHWNAESHAWEGTLKHEYVYTNGLNTSYTAFVWENNAWTADTAYTYIYDEAGRVKQYEAFARNAHGQFVQVSKWLKDYNAAGTLILDERYNQFVDNQPIGEYKKVWEYEGSNQTLYEYYDSYSNGAWVGNSREVWQYTSGQKTYYENQTWANGAWANSSKEIWVYQKFGSQTKQTLNEKYSWSNEAWTITSRDTANYNAAGKQLLSEKYALANGVLTGSSKEIWDYNANNLQTLHRKYTWTNNDWLESLREIADYDANKNKILDEKYELKNGELKPKSKTEYAFNSNKKNIATITYKVANDEFVKKDSTVNAYDAAGNTTESKTKYTWTNGAWIGSGNRVLKSYNSAKKVIEQVTMTWPTNATGWVNFQRDSTLYSGANITRTATWKWQNEAWVGTKRTDNHYNAAGLNDTIKTYTDDGTGWIYSQRTVYTYDAKKNKILTEEASWEDDKWVMTSMERLDIQYDEYANEVLRAKWECGADTIWEGIAKDSSVFSASGQLLFYIIYDTWRNNNWVPKYKIEHRFDESNRDTLEQRYDWNVNKWEGRYWYHNKYDESGRRISHAEYDGWSSTYNNWVGSSRIDDRYNSEGQKEFETRFTWRNNEWVPLFLYSFVYDESNHEIDQIIQMYIADNLINTNRYEKEYKGNELVKNNEYAWLNDEWTFVSRNEVYYDGNKLRREIQGTWNNGAVVSYFDNLYFYDSDYQLYTIRFENYDGALLQSVQVKETKTPAYDGAEPTKPATEQYTYTFKGWTPAIATVTGDATYTAEYDSVVNRYCITWLNADDVEVAVDSLEYGAMPSHEDVVKPSTSEWAYLFAGWSPAIVAVTGDATYKAQLDSIQNGYRITWLDADDTELAADSLSYGAMPSHEYVLKANTAEWTYSFVGWTPEIAAVTGDATYKAQIDSVRNRYRITWLDADDTELAADSLEYGATPSREYVLKANTAEWTYSFVGWTPEIAVVTGDATYKAQLDSIQNGYRITWLDADDTEIAVDSLAYGATPSREYVLKANTAEWTYSFVGWTPEIVAVTGDATYKAQIDSVRNSYRIVWLDTDDTELAVDSLAYGATPSREYVLKANTAEWTYSFVGWTPEIAAVTGDATYKAQIDSVRNRYRITWLDADDSEIAVDSLAYGATPSREYVLKANTAEWTYSFVGWTPEIAAVTGDATYKAQIDSVRNSYLITFKNGEETLQSTQVAYGSMPVYEGEEPTKQGDAQYTYSFNGWDAEIAAVTGEATYNATFISTVNTYTITWLMDDGTKIDEQEMAYGATPSHADAHKDNTAQYTITFVGWDKDFAAVTGDETYTAVFDSVVNTYTITFLFDNGVTVLDQQVFEYGQMPSTNFVPSRESDAQYSYTFTGWSPELVPVTGDASYVATFETMLNQYTIIFRNYDGTELQNTKVDYGTMPEYTGETPTRKGNMQYSYDFIGWSPELDIVRGDATYTAVFEQVLTTYTIIFYDEDGVTVLDSVEVEYGKKPSTTVIPTKEDDEQYTYTFAGWSPTIVAATRNTSYTATYTATLKSEGLWDVETDEKAQKVMIDGVMYVIRGGKKYGMDGAIAE